jgi:hypothetical protein
MAEAWCLRLAQQLGTPQLRIADLSPDLKSMLDYAERQLRVALTVSEGAGLTRSEGIRKRLHTLESGQLSSFPLVEVNLAPDTSTNNEVVPKTIFISYSHKDVKWLEAIKEYLVPLMRNRLIVAWDDTKIKAGDYWKSEIEQALEKASLALLIVTPNFIVSPYITETELPPILNAAAKRGLRIFWVPVSATYYEQTPLAAYQAVHNPEHPLDTLEPPKRRQCLVKIAKAIAVAVTT